MKPNQNARRHRIIVKAQKWGNSIGVRIPFKLAEKYRIEKGTELEIRETSEGIYLKPKDKLTLDDLLAQCEGENPYDEFFDKSVGKEEL